MLTIFASSANATLILLQRAVPRCSGTTQISATYQPFGEVEMGFRQSGQWLHLKGSTRTTVVVPRSGKVAPNLALRNTRDPVSVLLIFRSSGVLLGPGNNPTQPYVARVATMQPGSLRLPHLIRLKSAGLAGAASLWFNLQRSLDTALDVTAAPLPRSVRVGWEWSPGILKRQPSLVSMTAYHGAGRITYKDRTEWQPFAIAHEVGHLVLTANSYPGAAASGKHFLDQALVDKPALAWSEGFAWGFAGVVTKSGSWKINCEEVARIGGDAVIPMIEPETDRAHGQYNEITIGSAVFKWTDMFGDGSTKAGMHKLLTAFKGYAAKSGHTVQSMRDARLALVTGGLDKDEVTHADIGSMLWRLNIGWGVGVNGAEPTPVETNGSEADYGIDLILEGPGYTCRSNDITGGTVQLQGDGGTLAAKVDEGALQSIWQDDCVASNDDAPYGHDGLISLAFPYTGPTDHPNDLYTISARYHCTNGIPNDPMDPDEVARKTCTSERHFEGAVISGIDSGSAGDCPLAGERFHCQVPIVYLISQSKTLFDTNLAKDATTVIATFRPNGYCHNAIGGGDCSS